MLSEQSIVGARASVMIYDEVMKKWVPSGTTSGLSKVQIFHHIQNNTFRVVGRKLQDHEVVINCSILKGLKYNQATATFHQWRDAKYIYGLNFSSQQDAESFARAMMHTLEVLCGRALPQLTPTNQQPNISYDEDMGYRTMTREDADMMNHQQIISPQTPTTTQQGNQQQHQGHHRASSASSPPQNMVVQNMQNIPHPQQLMMMQQQQPPPMHHQIYASNNTVLNNQTQNQNGNQIYVPSSMSVQNSLNSIATSSIKPAPPMNMPPMGHSVPPAINNNYAASMVSVQQSNVPPPPPAFQNSAPAPPPGPPAPPAPPMMPPMAPPVNNSSSNGAPPPAPPPPPPMAKNSGMDMSSLATQLQAAKLRKTSLPASAENSGNSTGSNNNGAGNYGTIGRSTTGEMASMLDEMAKTLARRREKQKTNPMADGDNDTRDKWEKSNTLPHKISSSSQSGGTSLADSPKSRKRFGSASEEQILKQVNGNEFTLPSSSSFDMEAFKAEILKEIRSEIAKAKKEIIEAIKVEFNRR